MTPTEIKDWINDLGLLGGAGVVIYAFLSGRVVRKGELDRARDDCKEQVAKLEVRLGKLETCVERRAEGGD